MRAEAGAALKKRRELPNEWKWSGEDGTIDSKAEMPRSGWVDSGKRTRLARLAMARSAPLQSGLDGVLHQGEQHIDLKGLAERGLKES